MVSYSRREIEYQLQTSIFEACREPPVSPPPEGYLRNKKDSRLTMRRNGSHPAPNGTIRLIRLPVGESGCVCRLHVPAENLRRFIELGIVRGTTMQMVRRAPWGGPVLVDVDGCRLSLSRRDAESVELQPIAGESWTVAPEALLHTHALSESHTPAPCKS